MKIGVLGFGFTNSNKGCEALAYSFVSMLQELVPTGLEIHVFGYTEIGRFTEKYPDITFINYRLQLKSPFYWVKIKRLFDQMDCIFDITYGDGFSDIYGKMWNVNTNITKQLANLSSAPLVLLPQTYGPYENAFLRKWAYKIVKESAFAFARDAQSATEMNQVIGEKVVAATDLAFALPFDHDRYAIDGDKLNIGMNVSSLLWDGGHNIKLKTNYQEYCRRMIEMYADRDDVQIHLIPHVIAKSSNYHALENDTRVCDILHEEYPSTVKAPNFKDPIEAKSYISQMDVFMGARMHSTIGSMSSGVPTIPFSYSKKFEGLFGNLNYPYVISATKIDTDEAVAQTKEYINNCSMLENARKNSMNSVKKKLALIEAEIRKLLFT